MAFKLSKIGPNRFGAAAGVDFEIGMEADAGAVRLQSATYNGQTKTAGPFRFTAVSDSKNLAMVYAATDPGATVRIVEVDGAARQDLTNRSGARNTAVLRIN